MAKEYAIDETFRQGKVNLKVCEGLCIDCYFFSRPKEECGNMACLNFQREDNQDVITREENYTGETTDTFRINLNDIKIELNQETNADLEGTDVIKAVWQILGNAISSIKETLTK